MTTNLSTCAVVFFFNPPKTCFVSLKIPKYPLIPKGVSLTACCYLEISLYVPTSTACEEFIKIHFFKMAVFLLL